MHFFPHCSKSKISYFISFKSNRQRILSVQMSWPTILRIFSGMEKRREGERRGVEGQKVHPAILYAAYLYYQKWILFTSQRISFVVAFLSLQPRCFLAMIHMNQQVADLYLHNLKSALFDNETMTKYLKYDKRLQHISISYQQIAINIHSYSAFVR